MADDHFTPEAKLQTVIEKADSLMDSIELTTSNDESQTNKNDLERLRKALPDPIFPEIMPSYRGGKCTNSEARKMVEVLKEWASENLPEHNIYGAARDIESLFVRVWTEIDEALSALSMFKHILEKRAPDVLVARPEDSCFIYQDGSRVTGLETAMMYLHRWQDRGGAIGNVVQAGRPEHPIYELSQVKSRLRETVKAYSNMTDEAELAGEKIYDLLMLTVELLPEDMRRQKLLISTAIEIMENLNGYIYHKKERIEAYMPAEDSTSLVA